MSRHEFTLTDGRKAAVVLYPPLGSGLERYSVEIAGKRVGGLYDVPVPWNWDILECVVRKRYNMPASRI